jgi:hypothetical protein
MTSNTAPSPNVASDNGTFSAYYPWQAFDYVNNQDACWIGIGYTNQWLRYYWGGTSYVIKSYKVCSYYNDAANWYITFWTFQASQDGTNWTTLDTQTYQALNSAGTVYNITNTTGYKYYQIVPTAGTYSEPLIGALEMYGTATSSFFFGQ